MHPPDPPPAAAPQSIREKMASSSVELETKGLGYPTIKALRQAVTENGRWVLGTGYWVGGYWVLGTGYWVLGIGTGQAGTGYWAGGYWVLGRWLLDTG